MRTSPVKIVIYDNDVRKLTSSFDPIKSYRLSFLEIFLTILNRELHIKHWESIYKVISCEWDPNKLTRTFYVYFDLDTVTNLGVDYMQHLITKGVIDLLDNTSHLNLSKHIIALEHDTDALLDEPVHTITSPGLEKLEDEDYE
jgi:hypothetical protein